MRTNMHEQFRAAGKVQSMLRAGGIIIIIEEKNALP